MHKASRWSHQKMAVVSFILFMTAQTGWSTIHGDGAVYAWVIKMIAEGPWTFWQSPAEWMHGVFFGEHPYLFFYFAAALSQVFGTTDLGMKMPNYVIGLATVLLIYKISYRRQRVDQPSPVPGILAGYILILNSLYEMMLRQPTLDPMAQFLALGAVAILLFTNRSPSTRFFGAGLTLGLAFLTKGLELLPNAGALGLIGLCLARTQQWSPVRMLAALGLGLAIPLAAWIIYDAVFWDSFWMSYYYERQFANRFFNEAHQRGEFYWGYIANLISKQAVHLFLIGYVAVRNWRQNKKPDFFWWYTVCYLVLSTAAYTLIKKDSSQHLTGVFLCTSILLGQALYEIFGWIRQQALRTRVTTLFAGLHAFVLSVALGLSIWFWSHPNDKDDLWNQIIKVGQKLELDGSAQNIPVVVGETVRDPTGFYFTAQWYWKKNAVYFLHEAEASLIGKTVLMLNEKSDGRFSTEKMVYVSRAEK